MNNFEVIACDTDSIFFKKPSGESFSPEEIDKLNKELNSLYPDNIHWELNDYFSGIVTTKAKNYVLQTPDGKVKIKGSALKATSKELALQEFLKRFLEFLLEGKESEIVDLYNSYVKEICNLKEMKRWSYKKTITQSVLNPERTNEQKVLNAIEGMEGLQEGDKIRVFFKADETLALEEHFNGDYDKEVLLKKLFMTAKVLETVYPVKENLLNYSLKRNKKALETLFKNSSDILLEKLEQSNPELFKLTENSLPGRGRVFRAFDYFKPKDTKVIIIGQDPYPNKQDACGLAFSVEHNIIPRSLNNIFKELCSDMGYSTPHYGNLERWAKQGVLLLNSVLTVEEGKSGSHAKKGWEEFTTDKIQKAIDCNNPLVIICWGRYAKIKLLDLKLNDKILVLEGGHPSPLGNPNEHFFGKKYFSQANEWLKQNGLKEIDWYL